MSYHSFFKECKVRKKIWKLSFHLVSVLEKAAGGRFFPRPLILVKPAWHACRPEGQHRSSLMNSLRCLWHCSLSAIHSSPITVSRSSGHDVKKNLNVFLNLIFHVSIFLLHSVKTSRRSGMPDPGLGPRYAEKIKREMVSDSKDLIEDLIEAENKPRVRSNLSLQSNDSC